MRAQEGTIVVIKRFLTMSMTAFCSAVIEGRMLVSMASLMLGVIVGPRSPEMLVASPSKPYNRCPKPYSFFISGKKQLTLACVSQAFAYEMTLLLFLLTPLTPACCSCCNYKDQQHQQKQELTTLTSPTLPQNCLRRLTKHDTLLTPNLVSESPWLF